MERKYRVWLLLAPGFEEIEALATVDILRRAAMEVRILAVGAGESQQVRGAHDIVVVADGHLPPWRSDDQVPDLLVLPGGQPGTQNLAADANVLDWVRAVYSQGRFVAAICAAPSVLHKAGLLTDRRYTCFPGYEKEIGGLFDSHSGTVVDGPVVTGRGAGRTLEFALKLVELLQGAVSAEDLAKKMQIPAQAWPPLP